MKLRPAVRLFLTIALGLVVCAAPAMAGIADTVPQGVVIYDISYVNQTAKERWDSEGEKADLSEPVERFDRNVQLEDGFEWKSNHVMAVGWIVIRDRGSHRTRVLHLSSTHTLTTGVICGSRSSAARFVGWVW